jgi:3-hydroxyacyl-[acyl-carrier-protein] dehydratase
MTVSMIKKDDRLATLKMEGQVNGRQALSGRIVLERYNLADTDPNRRLIDENLIKHWRRMETILRSTRAPASGGA